MANSSIYVHDRIAGIFVQALKQAFSSVRTGDPESKDVNLGPQVDATQYQSILTYIQKGKKEGSLALGGKGHLETTGGYFIEPTIFTGTPEGSLIMREEVLGPVVNVDKFETEEEAIQKTNNTEYGFYADVYTKNLDRAMRFVKALDSGYVGVNCTSPTSARDLPFGGYKMSGQGREGRLYSMDNFLETKSVMMKIEGL